MNTSPDNQNSPGQNSPGHDAPGDARGKVEFLEKVDRLLDGPVDPELHVQILAALSQDESRKEVFAERLLLNAMLGHSLQKTPQADRCDQPIPLVRSNRSAPATPVPTWLFSGVSLIAIMAMFAVTYQSSSYWMKQDRPTRSIVSAKPAVIDEKPVVAILSQVGRCVWGSSSQPTAEGTALHAGSIELMAGVAEFSFVSGANMKLEGPAVLELISPMRCRLVSGAVTMSVPVSAHGFLIESPTGDVVDHGTEFGMRVEQGRAHVQVFEGEVEIAARETKESERLLRGQEAMMTPARIDILNQTNQEYSAFEEQRNLLSSTPVRHRIPSSEGGGAAEYVFSPGSYNNMSQTLLLLKNQTDLSWRRIAYLRFDVAKLPETLKQYETVSLTLSFVPSGIGYASTMPDCDFTIYGLLNEDSDHWSASDLSWENAPGIEGDDDLIISKVRPLAHFRIDRNETTGVRVIESPELTEYLKQDTNGLVTLIIARDTLGVGSSSLVHAFAGNRHPTVAPPSLEFSARE